MDIKKRFSLRMHSRRRGKKGDTAQLAAQLAPLEERDQRARAQHIGSGHSSSNGQAGRDYGAIVVDNDNLNVPKDIMEERDESALLAMEPVVLVILSIMLAFIAFIAWQISQMPGK